jgi:hypothetical protein
VINSTIAEYVEKVGMVFYFIYVKDQYTTIQNQGVLKEQSSRESRKEKQE